MSYPHQGAVIMHVPRKQTTKYLKWATRQKYFLPIRDRIRIVILAIRGKTIKEISSQISFWWSFLTGKPT
jgi:hypothetical protein